MISAGLEKMIWQGKACFKNYSYAFGQSGGIPIPENSLCVILGFKYTGCFLDKRIEEGRITPAKNIHFLRIESDKTVNDYLIKSHFLEIEQKLYTMTDADYECYIVAFNSIQIRIAIMPENKAGQITINGGAPPIEANEPVEPLGYKNQDIILEVHCPGVFGYNPLADRNKTLTGTTTRDAMNINFNALTLPNFPASQNFGDDGYPIINFKLCYIEKAFLNELLSSK